MAEKLLHVTVCVDDDDARERAVTALTADGREAPTVSSGLVTGWADAGTCESLSASGLLVQPIVTEETLAENGPAAIKQTPGYEERQQAFIARSAAVALDTEGAPGLRIAEGGAEVPPERRVRSFAVEAAGASEAVGAGGVAEAGSQAAAGAQPDGDAYEAYFRRPIIKADRDELARIGTEVLSSRPPNIYRMYMDAGQLEEVRALPVVSEVRPIAPATRVTSRLIVAAEAADRAASSGGMGLMADEAEAEVPADYDVFVHREQDVERVRDIIAGTDGAQIVGTDGIVIGVHTEMDPASLTPFLAALASLPQVQKVAPYERPKLYADEARKLIGVQLDDQGAELPWNGDGELVAIFDSGIDDHPDLHDRVVTAEAVAGPDASDMQGHGTHVAGIIAGTGAASGQKIRGIAPKAKLAVFRIIDEGGEMKVGLNLGDLLQKGVDAGAKIINLSWGGSLGGPYEKYSLAVDRFVHDHPDVLVVVAAGNKGAAPEGTHELRTIGTPATAKNVLTVGSCDTARATFADQTWGVFRHTQFPKPPAADEPITGHPDLPAADSARGPTGFESVKPDLLAPGTFILSARSSHIDTKLIWNDYADFDGRYVYIGGTSMAAPVVSGAAALLRQYLRTERATPAPSAALMKAILLASAKRLPTTRTDSDYGYPDYDQGFGRIDLRNILPAAGAPPLFWFRDVENGSPQALERGDPDDPHVGSRLYSFSVAPGGTRQLRLTLAWTDFPAKFIQNTLQLMVQPQGGAPILGNALNTYKKAVLDEATDVPELKEVLSQLALDQFNNVQEVTLDAPAAGDYTVRVVAQGTTFPPQGYALCVCGDLTGDLSDG